MHFVEKSGVESKNARAVSRRGRFLNLFAVEPRAVCVDQGCITTGEPTLTRS
jgi:hypothetical protein